MSEPIESVDTAEVEWCLAYELATGIVGHAPLPGVAVTMYRAASPKARATILAAAETAIVTAGNVWEWSCPCCGEVQCLQGKAPPSSTPLADAWFAAQEEALYEWEDAEPKEPAFEPDPNETDAEARLRWARETGTKPGDKGRETPKATVPTPEVVVSPDLATLRDTLPPGFLETLSEEQRTALFEIRVYPEGWTAVRVKHNQRKLHELAQQLRAARKKLLGGTR